MQYDVIPTPKFEKDLKKLGKKNRNIGQDIRPILEELENGQLEKAKVIMQFNDDNNIAMKVRVASASRGMGKSGSYRLICYAEKANGEIYLLTLYSKSEKENISNKEILELVLKYVL